MERERREGRFRRRLMGACGAGLIMTMFSLGSAEAGESGQSKVIEALAKRLSALEADAKAREKESAAEIAALKKQLRKKRKKIISLS